MAYTTEQGPTQPQMESYFDTLRTALADVPELQIGFDLTREDPEFATTTYLGYMGLVGHIVELNGHDRQIIQSAKVWMKEHQGVFGTASEVSVDELLAELGEHVDVIPKLVSASADPESPYFQPAMAELTRRMEGGHHLKASGGNPSDSDPESKKVIWGHTMMTNPDPHTLIHFMVAHYTERFFAVGLQDHGSVLATQKDFLLNALIDVVILDHLTTNRFANIYDVWRRPKGQAGLGWITDDRLASYTKQSIN